MDKRLAPSIPEDMLERIYSVGRENYVQKVYRVIKRGKIDETAFYNTFDEETYEGRKHRDKKDDIGVYGTSCSLTQDSPKMFLGLLKKKYFDKYPRPQIAVGHTLNGLMQRTVERNPDYADENHIDWWIYQDGMSEIIDDYRFLEDGHE